MSVSDEGPGIPVDQRQRVFERFVRLNATQIHGSGLGLTIVERAAAQHGARVTLQDGPAGRGLTVSLALTERG